MTVNELKFHSYSMDIRALPAQLHKLQHIHHGLLLHGQSGCQLQDCSPLQWQAAYNASEVLVMLPGASDKLQADSADAKAEVEAVFAQLPAAETKELADQLAVNLCHLSSKGLRKRLVSGTPAWNSAHLVLQLGSSP